MRSMATVLCVAICAGCGGSALRGKVDGDRVPVVDAFFVEDSRYFSSTDGLIGVTLSSVKQACEVGEAFWEDAEDETDPAELADLWEESFPADFWQIDLLIRVDDPGDDLGGVEYGGVDWDDYPSDDDEVTGVLTHYVELLDEDWFAGTYDDTSDYFDFWYTHEGDLKITGHKPGERIAGVFDTIAAETDDGDEVGEIQIRFRAERCRGMEDFLL